MDVGARDAARKEIEAARDLSKKLFDQYPSVLQYQVELAGSYCNTALCVQDDQPAEGLVWFGRAIEILESVHRSYPQHAVAKRYLRNSYWSRSWLLVVLKKYAEALKDLDTAIALSPPAEQPTIRACRAYAKSRAGLFADAVVEVAELTKSSNWSFQQWYDFACVYSVASSKIADKKKEYADRAMELLRQAAKAGPMDAAHVNDHDLDPLRDRGDFKKLIAELEAKGK
jgi:tetratricopeptide (TPR) repeat protein